MRSGTEAIVCAGALLLEAVRGSGASLLPVDSEHNAIHQCLAAARENLRQVREQCSTEMWEQLNRLYLQVSNTSKNEAWMLNSHIFYRAVQVARIPLGMGASNGVKMTWEDRGIYVVNPGRKSGSDFSAVG